MGRPQNIQLTNRLYRFITENGPQTTAQMKFWVNNIYQPIEGGKARNKRTHRSTSSEQITGVMRASPLFKCIGTDEVLGFKKPYHAQVYDVVPVATVVDNMLDDEGQLKSHRLRKRLPPVIKEEIKSRGLTL
jgi:hypothetical protein